MTLSNSSSICPQDFPARDGTLIFEPPVFFFAWRSKSVRSTCCVLCWDADAASRSVAGATRYFTVFHVRLLTCGATLTPLLYRAVGICFFKLVYIAGYNNTTHNDAALSPCCMCLRTSWKESCSMSSAGHKLGPGKQVVVRCWQGAAISQDFLSGISPADPPRLSL